MERTTLDLWVGLFVTAGMAALVILALKVGNLSSVSMADSYLVRGHFANIGGLKVRAPVKSSGVVVGRVAEISFDTEKYEALITMKLDKRYQFPKDTSASILTSGLLGEQYIGLDPGGDDKRLQDGDEVKLTQSAIVIEQLIGQFLYGKAAEGEQDKKGKE